MPGRPRAGDLVPLNLGFLICKKKKYENNSGVGKFTPEAAEQAPSLGLAGVLAMSSERHSSRARVPASALHFTTLLCVLGQSLLSRPLFSHWSSKDSRSSDD